MYERGIIAPSDHDPVVTEAPSLERVSDTIPADAKPLLERIDVLRQHILSSGFDANLQLAYDNELMQLAEKISDIRDQDPTVRKTMLAKYDRILSQNEASYGPQTADVHDPGLGDAWADFTKAGEYNSRDLVDVTNPASMEAYKNDLIEKVKQIMMVANERLLRNGDPAHVAALKLVGQLRLRYYQWDQLSQRVEKIASSDSPMRVALVEKLNAQHEAIADLVQQLQEHPLFSEVDDAEVGEEMLVAEQSQLEESVTPGVGEVSVEKHHDAIDAKLAALNTMLADERRMPKPGSEGHMTLTVLAENCKRLADELTSQPGDDESRSQEDYRLKETRFAETYAAFVALYEDQSGLMTEVIPEEMAAEEFDIDAIEFAARALLEDPVKREKAQVLLGAIQAYRRAPSENTRDDIKKRYETLMQPSLPPVEQERVKHVVMSFLQNKAFVIALLSALGIESLNKTDATTENTTAAATVEKTTAAATVPFTSGWVTGDKPAESIFSKRTEQHAFVLSPEAPEVGAALAAAAASESAFAAQAAAVESTPTKLTVRVEESDVARETGVTLEAQTDFAQSPVFAYSQNAEVLPIDQNMSFNEGVPPSAQAPEMHNEPAPEKITYTLGSGPDHYIENYWSKLVRDVAPDIPREVTEEFARQVLLEMYADESLQQSMGIKNPDQTFEGDTIDYTEAVKRFNTRVEAYRLERSQSPAPLAAASESLPDTVETEPMDEPEMDMASAESAPLAESVAPLTPETYPGGAKAFTADYQNWLHDRFGVEAKESWLSSVFTAGFDNQNLLKMTVADINTLAQLPTAELVTELTAERISLTAFQSLQKLIVEERQQGVRAKQLDDPELVSEALTKAFLRTAANVG
jgi:hypothetical protein